MRVSLVALALLALLAGCGSQRNTLDRLWHASGQAVALVPGTSDYAPGDVRVSFLVVTDQGRVVSRPTADVWVARAQNAEPFVHTVARLEPIGVRGGYVDPDSQSIYVAHVPFPRAGKYWLVARPIGGDVHIAGIHDIEVKQRSAAPAVGSRAIASRTPTLGTAPIRLLTTRIPPDRALLRYSVAASLAVHVPFVVVFATPRFCTSRTCGPVVDVVDRVRRDLAGTPVRFIHVEIYKDNNPARGENEWVRQWHLPSEPWAFLVGRDGRIKAKFEGAFSAPNSRVLCGSICSRRRRGCRLANDALGLCTGVHDVQVLETLSAEPPPEALYTVREVAGQLGVHPETIRRLIHDGRLDAVRVGRVLRVHKEAVDGFLARQRIKPTRV